jgi:hypothetical protein
MPIPLVMTFDPKVNCERMASRQGKKKRLLKLKMRLTDRMAF